MSEDVKAELVALRDRREEVIQVLTDAFASDRIDIESFEDRTARAHRATSFADLDAVIADLGPLASELRHAPLAPIVVDASPHPMPASRALAIFGSVERRGSWRVPKHFRVLTVFGNTVLDFRSATFAPGITELKVRVVFGTLAIIVPPNLAVECEGTGIFGAFEQWEAPATDPERPVLRIVGTAVFGTVEIETRLPGESDEEAIERRHHRALPPRERPLLPPRS